MTMTVPVAQMRIVREVRDAEAALDDAILKNLALFTTLISARRETGSAPFLGHSALVRLSKSQQTLLDAGGELARAHSQLQQVQADIVGYLPCPENETMGCKGEHSRAA